MVRRTTCTRLECAHVIPGGFLQVRLYRGENACGCINAYNYVSVEDPQSVSRRASFWQALSTTISNIPLRNTMVLAGDLYTPHKHHRGFCDPGVLPLRDSCPEDMSDLTRILEVRDLCQCILNPWQTRSSPTTFDFEQRYQSQIDHIIVRRQLPDHESKQAHPTASFACPALAGGLPKKRRADVQASL